MMKINFTNDPLDVFLSVESQRYSIGANVASGVKSLVFYIRQSEEFKRLSTIPRESILRRALLLLTLACDLRYVNPYDIAMVSYCLYLRNAEPTCPNEILAAIMATLPMGSWSHLVARATISELREDQTKENL